QIAAADQEAESAPAASAPQTDDLPRRRMAGWKPLQVGHPGAVAPAAAQTESTPESVPTPTPAATPPAEPAPEPDVTIPDVLSPQRDEQPTETRTAEKDMVKDPYKNREMFITLGNVVVAGLALMFIAQWLRSLDPVANFIVTYDVTR